MQYHHVFAALPADYVSSGGQFGARVAGVIEAGDNALVPPRMYELPGDRDELRGDSLYVHPYFVRRLLLSVFR